MVKDNKPRRLCGFGGRTSFKKFDFLSAPYGLDGLSPEENIHEQYFAQRDSSKELLDSSLDIHTSEAQINWLKYAGFKDGLHDVGLGRVVKWNEIPPPSEDTVDLAFRKEVENQVRLFRGAEEYFAKFKQCG